MNGGWGISYEIALKWMPLDLTDDKPTLVRVMAWCRQATSHYMSQCWPRSMSPNGVTRPVWVNNTIKLQKRVVSIISNAKYSDSEDSLYRALETLKWVDINKYLTARFMFRYCNNHVPELFNSYFEYYRYYHKCSTFYYLNIIIIIIILVRFFRPLCCTILLLTKSIYILSTRIKCVSS